MDMKWCSLCTADICALATLGMSMKLRPTMFKTGKRNIYIPYNPLQTIIRKLAVRYNPADVWCRFTYPKIIGRPPLRERCSPVRKLAVGDP